MRSVEKVVVRIASKHQCELDGRQHVVLRDSEGNRYVFVAPSGDLPPPGRLIRILDRLSSGDRARLVYRRAPTGTYVLVDAAPVLSIR